MSSMGIRQKNLNAAKEHTRIAGGMSPGLIPSIMPQEKKGCLLKDKRLIMYGIKNFLRWTRQHDIMLMVPVKCFRHR